MNNLKQIVLLTSMESIHSAALAHAERLAAATGAKLHILVPVYSRMIAFAGLLNRKGAAEARLGMLQQLERLLRHEAAAIQLEGVEVTTELLWATPKASAVLRRIDALNPDLVIKVADPERSVSWPGRSLDRALLRHCRQPVLISRRASGIPQHIAASVDMNRPWPYQGEISRHLVEEAESLAGIYGADLHLIQAEPAVAEVATSDRRRRSSPASQIKDAFVRLADSHGVPGKRRHRLPGATVPAILEFLDHNTIDLLVVGNPQRPAAQRLLFGNHAERINLHADCDIITFSS